MAPLPNQLGGSAPVMRFSTGVFAPHERASAWIGAIAYDCGFGDLSYFYRVFRQRYGVSASDVRAMARSN
jgi:methylphosphotriester-DNA--protein-cysteine methyltransferase